MPLSIRDIPVLFMRRSAYIEVKSGLGLQLFQALSADPLVLKILDPVHVVAKQAGGVIFLQDNALVFNKDLQRVLYLDIQILADLRRQHDSAQFVYFSYHSR